MCQSEQPGRILPGPLPGPPPTTGVHQRRQPPPFAYLGEQWISRAMPCHRRLGYPAQRGVDPPEVQGGLPPAIVPHDHGHAACTAPAGRAWHKLACGVHLPSSECLQPCLGQCSSIPLQLPAAHLGLSRPVRTAPYRPLGRLRTLEGIEDPLPLLLGRYGPPRGKGTGEPSTESPGLPSPLNRANCHGGLSPSRTVMGLETAEAQAQALGEPSTVKPLCILYGLLSSAPVPKAWSRSQIRAPSSPPHFARAAMSDRL